MGQSKYTQDNRTKHTICSKKILCTHNVILSYNPSFFTKQVNRCFTIQFHNHKCVDLLQQCFTIDLCVSLCGYTCIYMFICIYIYISIYMLIHTFYIFTHKTIIFKSENVFKKQINIFKIHSLIIENNLSVLTNINPKYL